ncbi:MAG: hypothetical protein V4730_11665 [Pseudomonadota bacterium]
MAMTPKTKDRLSRFTLIAKAIIYDSNRMQQFLQMMSTKDGAITAVKSVMGAIDSKKPIPADVAPLLGVNVYMLLVDVAQDVTGRKPNPEIIRDVIWKIMNLVKPAEQEQPQPAAQPGGLMQQPMGV